MKDTATKDAPETNIGVQEPDGTNTALEPVEATEQTAPKEKTLFTDKQQEHLNSLISETIKRERERAEKLVDEAKKLQQMDATEKAEFERKKLEQERDDAIQQVQRFQLGATATSHLISEGLTADNTTLEFVIRNSEAETVAAVGAFAKQVRDQAQKLLAKQLSGTPPKTTPKPGATTLTREDINKVSDPVERQRLIADNPHLYTR